MKTVGSIIALIGGILVILAGLGTLFINGMDQVWKVEYSAATGFVSIGTILSLVIVILAFISITFQPKVLGAVILMVSFAGIIFGGTFVDICMIITIIGGFLLITMGGKKTDTESINPTFYQKWWFWILLGLLCLAILYGLYYVMSPVLKPATAADSLKVQTTQLPTTNTVVNATNAITTTPEEMLRMYNQNGFTADAKFKGNITRITGKIFDIKSLNDGGSVIVFKSFNTYNEELEKESVNCYFNSAETADQTRQYKVGDTVSVIGVVQGSGGKLDDITVENCSFDTP